MLSSAFIALTLAVSLVAGSLAPQTVPCNFVAADGTQYDLSALTVLRGDPYVYADKQGKIYFNICGTLAGLKPNPCGTDASVCIVDNNGVSSNAGSVLRSEWSNSAVDPNSGVDLIYGGGDKCESKLLGGASSTSVAPRKTSLQFKCVTDSFASSSIRVANVDHAGCNTVITIETAYACPVKEESDNDDPDSNVVAGDSSDSESGNAVGGWDDYGYAYAHFHAANLFLVMMISFFSTLMCLCLCACSVRKRKCRAYCKRQQERNAAEMSEVTEPLLQQVVSNEEAPVAVGIPYHPDPYAYTPQNFVPTPVATQPPFFYYGQLPVNPPDYTVATAPVAPVVFEDQVSADERFARQLQAHFNAEQ